MYIEAVPNRHSPPAILLRESYRENGKVRKRTLRNLSDWPAEHIEGLRGVLRGGIVIPAEREAMTVMRRLPHGHVAAALGTARKIGLDRVLGPDGNRCRDLVHGLMIATDHRSDIQARHRSRAVCGHGDLEFGAKRSAWGRSTKTNSTRHWIGCRNVRVPSRARWPNGI